ncbi:MAG: proton-conducting transporter membrane subunit [Planctomycetota bacterium]
MTALVIVAPLLGAALVFAAPRSRLGLAFGSAFAAAGVALAAAIALFARGGEARITRDWIEGIPVRLALETDGLAVVHLLLVTLVVPAALAAALRVRSTRRRSFAALALVFEGLLALAFTARDLVLFYGVWELAAVVLFFAIALARGREHVRVAQRLVLFSSFGSLPLLVALLYLRRRLGGDGIPLDLEHLASVRLTLKEQWLGGIAFGLAFAAKLGVFPLHRWTIAVARGAAPAIPVLLAAGWFALGIYGALRFATPLFPDALAAARPLLVALALAGLWFSALRTLYALDRPRLYADLQSAWMALALLGLVTGTEAGEAGAVLASLVAALGGAIARLVDGVPGPGARARVLLRRVAAAGFLALPGLGGFAAWLLVLRGAAEESTLTAALLGGAGIAATWGALGRHRERGESTEDEATGVAGSRFGPDLVAALILAAALFGLGLMPAAVVDRLETTRTVAAGGSR